LNIPGNEEADKVIKEGASFLAPLDIIYTLISFKRLAKEKAKDSVTRL
jgi:hypothetical protein